MAAKAGLPDGSKPLDLVFHGGSGSLPEEISAAVDYGVVKMNVDTDTQYAFTRPVADHMLKNYDGVLKIDGEVGNKKAVRPARLGQGGRGRHGRPRRRGLPEPALRRPPADLSRGGGPDERTRQPARADPTPRPSCPDDAGIATPSSTAVRRPRQVAAAAPDPAPLAWAVLAEQALADGAPVAAYAFARTGYHRGLDALRRSGWRGPWAGAVGARAQPRLPAGARRARPGGRRDRRGRRGASAARSSCADSSPTAVAELRG